LLAIVARWWASKRLTPGPYQVAAGQALLAGAVAGSVISTGAEQGLVFCTGAMAGQIYG
jgi:hypothetical protein